MASSLASGTDGRVVSTKGSLSWTQMADLLGKASLFVGVDTAAMHLAAASGCPSVALFGNPPAYQYRPWKVPHRIVRARDAMPEKERIRLTGESLMAEISEEEVLNAVDALLRDQPLAASRV